MRGSNMFLKGCLWGGFFVAWTAAAHAELILYYSFEQDVGPGGTVVNQANPSAYNGTLQADAYTADGVLYLDGTGDFLQTSLPTGNLTTPVTFSFWMNASQVRKSPTLSGYLVGNPNRWDIQLSRNDDQKIRFIAHQDNSGPVSTSVIAANTWYHVAVVHRGAGNTVSLYVNGALESTTSMAYGLNTGIDMMIGKGDGSNFAGQLDDVAIWNNEALSSGQIRGIAQQAAVAIADGDWFTPATWFRSGQGAGDWQRLPDALVDAVIAGGRTVTISSGTAQAKNLVIGATGETATLNLAGGTLTLAGNITRYGTGSGTLNLVAGTLNVNGSSITVDRFQVGADPGANAQFTLASGKTLTTDTLAVGGQGTGVFNFSGSGLTANRVLLGPGGTIICTGSDVAWTFTKTMDITGGLLQISNGALALNAGATASLSGGEIRILYGYVGYNASPLTTFTQTGGLFTVKNDLAVGRTGAAQGSYLLEDGTLEVGTASRTAPALRVGRAATGTFTQKGGLVRIPYGGLSLGEEGGNGTYNLEGGVLNTPSITRGATGTAAFNWTGGTLHVDTFGSSSLSFNLRQQGGVLAPGRSIGSTTIYGNYLQEEAGVLEIEIASPTRFDTVTVTGQAVLDGWLQIVLLGGYQPTSGQTFNVLTAASGIQDMGIQLQWDPAGLLPSQYWIYQIVPGQGAGQILQLQVGVPEPSSGSLALLGLAGLGLAAGYRLRRRRPGW